MDHFDVRMQEISKVMRTVEDHISRENNFVDSSLFLLFFKSRCDSILLDIERVISDLKIAISTTSQNMLSEIVIPRKKLDSIIEHIRGQIELRPIFPPKMNGNYYKLEGATFARRNDEILFFFKIPLIKPGNTGKLILLRPDVRVKAANIADFIILNAHHPAYS